MIYKEISEQLQTALEGAPNSVSSLALRESFRYMSHDEVGANGLASRQSKKGVSTCLANFGLIITKL